MCPFLCNSKTCFSGPSSVCLYTFSSSSEFFNRCRGSVFVFSDSSTAWGYDKALIFISFNIDIFISSGVELVFSLHVNIGSLFNGDLNRGIGCSCTRQFVKREVFQGRFICVFNVFSQITSYTRGIWHRGVFIQSMVTRRNYSNELPFFLFFGNMSILCCHLFVFFISRPAQRQRKAIHPFLVFPVQGVGSIIGEKRIVYTRRAAPRGRCFTTGHSRLQCLIFHMPGIFLQVCMSTSRTFMGVLCIGTKVRFCTRSGNFNQIFLWGLNYITGCIIGGRHST